MAVCAGIWSGTSHYCAVCAGIWSGTSHYCAVCAGIRYAPKDYLCTLVCFMLRRYHPLHCACLVHKDEGSHVWYARVRGHMSGT